MRKFFLALALATGGCSALTATPSGKLAGTNDLVLVDGWLFITSTTANELRVLDVSLENSDFVRAPNPLEPLSIPVLGRPKGLAREWRFDVETNSSSYVYVSSPGAPEVSVVSVSSMQEVFRLTAPAPVTAMAAEGRADLSSTLYVATFDGVDATLFQWDLPASTAAPLPTSQEISDARKVLETFPGEAVSVMQSLPRGNLAVATRSQSGRGGRTFVLDRSTSPSTQFPMQFPAPVNQLTTHFPGTRLFGVLDEGACSDTSCRGLLAVEVDTGAVATDSLGAPMLPLRSGEALLRGVAVARGMTAPGGLENQVLGALTDSSGRTSFFDAAALRIIDADTAGPSVASLTYQTAPTAEAPDGVEAAFVGGPSDVRLTEGATREETVTLTYQGLLPQLARLPVGDSTPGRFRIPADVASRVQPQDILTLLSNAGPCAETTVTAVEIDAVVVAPEVDAACLAGGQFGLRASGSNPFVVVGSETGYLGRVGPGQSFVFQGDYFHHADTFVPSQPQPQLSFQMGPLEPGMARDARYELRLDDGFTAHASTPDPNRVGTRFNMPGAVEFDAVRQRVYVAYPSADALLVSEPKTAPVGLNRNVEVRR